MTGGSRPDMDGDGGPQALTQLAGHGRQNATERVGRLAEQDVFELRVTADGVDVGDKSKIREPDNVVRQSIK
jgi:hypothetical protein